MHTVALSTLHEIHEIMLEMSKAIEKADWVVLVRLDNERRQLVDKSSTYTAKEYRTAEHGLQDVDSPIDERQLLTKRILDLDTKLRRSLEDLRGKLKTEHSEYSAKKKAVAGYAQANTFI